MSSVGRNARSIARPWRLVIRRESRSLLVPRTLRSVSLGITRVRTESITDAHTTRPQVWLDQLIGQHTVGPRSPAGWRACADWSGLAGSSQGDGRASNSRAGRGASRENSREPPRAEVGARAAKGGTAHGRRREGGRRRGEDVQDGKAPSSSCMSGRSPIKCSRTVAA